MFDTSSDEFDPQKIEPLYMSCDVLDIVIGMVRPSVVYLTAMLVIIISS